LPRETNGPGALVSNRGRQPITGFLRGLGALSGGMESTHLAVFGSPSRSLAKRPLGQALFQLQPSFSGNTTASAAKQNRPGFSSPHPVRNKRPRCCWWRIIAPRPSNLLGEVVAPLWRMGGGRREAGAYPFDLLSGPLRWIKCVQRTHDPANRIHNDGIAECGIFQYEMAKAKATQVSGLCPQTSSSASMRYRAQGV